MIIKSVILENFQCYYDKKEFCFKPGLNIILGDNGEGKTKFFEGAEWLFNGDRFELDKLVSKKKLAEEYNKDLFPVSVSMAVTKNDQEYIFKKSFCVESKKEGIKTSAFNFVCYHTNEKGERESFQGNKASHLLDEIFPPEIRRFSMFKGEADLNIFKSGEEALSNLIKSFSDAKYYDKYCSYGRYLKKKAEKEVNKDVKKSSKNKEEFDRLHQLIIPKKEALKKHRNILNQECENLEIIREDLKDADKHFDNAKNVKVIQERISKLRKEKETIQRRIVTDFSIRLFDEKWLLIYFEKIQKEFNDKINDFEKKRRDEEEKFNIEKGKAQRSNEIFEQITPLPVGVPSLSHMREMLSEEYCKVCNRSAPKGTDAYKYMEKRLQEFVSSQQPKKEKQQERLYRFNYLSKLWSLSDNSTRQVGKLKSINQEIKGVFEFNLRLKSDLAVIEKKLGNEEREIYKITAKSNAEEDLSSIYSNVKEWKKQESRFEMSTQGNRRKIDSLQNEIELLKRKKEDIDSKDAKSFLIETRSILRDVETIFLETRERKYEEFLQKLEDKSNEIFTSINVDDFTGVIQLTKEVIGDSEKVKVHLLENDNLYDNPNQSLQTTKHMALLFAISELASEVSSYGSEKYPMIFDAPTSSFGMKKTLDFLNLLNSTQKQRIIATYEFVGRDSFENQEIEEEFSNVNRAKAFWLRREPFDRNDLSTINTKITTI